MQLPSVVAGPRRYTTAAARLASLLANDAPHSTGMCRTACSETRRSNLGVLPSRPVAESQFPQPTLAAARHVHMIDEGEGR